MDYEEDYECGNPKCGARTTEAFCSDCDRAIDWDEVEAKRRESIAERMEY